MERPNETLKKIDRFYLGRKEANEALDELADYIEWPEAELKKCAPEIFTGES